jgi:hypothetical protein
MPSRVYVIELARGAGRRRDPRLPWLYVGSTGRRIATRFEQHRRGYKSAGIVKRHGLRLRPDLYEDLPAFPGSRSALAAERERALELAACGFVAHCDGTSYGRRGEPGAGPWREWGAERLEPVLPHLEAAVAELAAGAFRPPSPGELAHLLYGTRGFWLAELIDPDDPPPTLGLFPHVRLDLLAERAAALVGAPAGAGL